jgi:hypothetical protein
MQQQLPPRNRPLWLLGSGSLPRNQTLSELHKR